ncbi:hypothetical protein [Micromonospora parathelypteridis]|uniref:Uncharacterized protein n=1 Tax=Micromonospora parathelypteridis TaxID=1839617 RepID=A0A840W5F2_9ACTN|nr:hypothetical protein [Micromonospora parathelypteridis]MBB5480000.1 hypothetical protein [Micromonospora parathelypteridis]
MALFTVLPMCQGSASKRDQSGTGRALTTAGEWQPMASFSADGHH